MRSECAQFVRYTRPHKQTNPPNKKPMFAPIQKPNVIAAAVVIDISSPDFRIGVSDLDVIWVELRKLARNVPGIGVY
jgi:hypothetical protein